MKLLVNGEKIIAAKLVSFSNDKLIIDVGGKLHSFDYINEDSHVFKLSNKESIHKLVVSSLNDTSELFYNGQYATVKIQNTNSGSLIQDDVKQLEYHSPMPGKISKIVVEVGQQVKKGDVLLYLEAMKMEHPIKAKMHGEVETVLVNLGNQVNQNQLLIKLKNI